MTLKGKRTYLAALLQSIPPVVVMADELIRTLSAQGESLMDKIPSEYIVGYLMVVLLSKVWLRTITTTAPFKDKE